MNKVDLCNHNSFVTQDCGHVGDVPGLTVGHTLGFPSYGQSMFHPNIIRSTFYVQRFCVLDVYDHSRIQQYTAVYARVKFQAHSRHIHIQVTFGTHSIYIQVTFKSHSEHIKNIFNGHSERFKSHSSHIQVIFKSHSSCIEFTLESYSSHWNIEILEHCDIGILRYYNIELSEY